MKIETKEIAGFIPALHGMRSPMNSWHLNDSWSAYGGEHIEIGPKDMDLAKRLIKAGPEHCKFLRQIQVWAEIDMPLYWWKEMDLYKHKETNSCSTMHTITKRYLTLDDFAIDMIKEHEPKQEVVLYETPEWKDIDGYDGMYQVSSDGRVRKVSTGKIGKIIIDNRGYSKKAITKDGKTTQYSIHRLVAKAFIPNPENKPEVNHINGNKLDNRIENLEWVTRSENMKHAHESGLQTYSGYIQLKQREAVGKFTSEDIEEVFDMKKKGMSNRKIAEHFNVAHSTIGAIINRESYKSIELSDLDILKSLIDRINTLIDLFNDTGDRKYFKMIIQMLPSSFKQKRLFNTNYAQLINIYHQRKNHRLKEEWQDTFCRWVEDLPYMDEFLNCK